MTPHPERVEEIEVVLEGGRRKVVTVEASIGLFAIHPRVVKGETYGPGYTITHRPSGLEVWSVLLLVDAYKVAKYLNEQQLDWLKLTEEQRTTLTFDLTSIASRPPHVRSMRSGQGQST